MIPGKKPNQTGLTERQKYNATRVLKCILEQRTDIVDEARPVAVLDDLDGSDSAASVQGEALAPAWNSVRVDPFADPHRAPGINTHGASTRRMFERLNRIFSKQDGNFLTIEVLRRLKRLKIFTAEIFAYYLFRI